jgi:monoamine oxidase
MRARTIVFLVLWSGLAWWNPTQSIGLAHASLCGSTDVLIVGAGFSGLSAAKELKARNVEFRIIESTNRIGGRVSSVQPPNFDGLWVEEGANWMFPGTPNYDYAKKRGLKMTGNNMFDAQMFEYNDGSNSVSH